MSGDTQPFNSLQSSKIGHGRQLRDRERSKPDQEHAQADARTSSRRAKKGRDELKALVELAGEMNQKASIPFCVYAVLGERDDEAAHRVVIFQSGQPGEPEARRGEETNPKQ